VNSAGPEATGEAGAGAAEALSGLPHSPQYFCPGAEEAPHTAQRRTSAVPHSPQNFIPSALAVWQVGQII
jgi:hypothetical protein